MALDLDIAVELAGVKSSDVVISWAAICIATGNAISYVGAEPLFVDVDVDTMGLSPVALKSFLEENAEKRTSGAFNKTSGKRISACVPMHTFGFPCRIAAIAEICADRDITLIENARTIIGVENQYPYQTI